MPVRNSYESMIQNTYASNDDLWDITAVMTYHMPNVVSSGALIDLRSTEYLDFEKPYWLSALIEDSTINDRIYFAAGDASLSLLKNTICLLYNKELALQNGISDIQNTVLDGNWTADLFRQYSTAAYCGVNPTSPDVTTDTFGFGVQNYNHLSAFGAAFGLRILTRNDDGEYNFTYANDRAVDAVQFLCNLFHNNPGFITTDNFNDHATEIYNSFMEGRMLFISTTFDNLTNIYAEISGDYGIIPYPKWSEDEEYSTFARNTYMSFGIMRTTPSSSMASAVLECIASESYKEITPAFFETAMKVRYSDAIPPPGRSFGIGAIIASGISGARI